MTQRPQFYPGLGEPGGGDMPTREVVRAVKRAALRRAFIDVRRAWTSSRLDDAREASSPVWTPLQDAALVGLAALMRLCPEVEGWKLARTLGMHPATPALAAERLDRGTLDDSHVTAVMLLATAALEKAEAQS